MSNYISNYSGSQIDNVIGLFHGKGLNQVTGLVQRNADGSFSQGSGGGSDNIFIAYSDTNYSDIKNAIEAGYAIHFAVGNSSTALKCPVIGYRAATFSEFNTLTIIYQNKYFDPYKLTTRVYYSDNRTSTIEETSLQALLVSGTNIKTINNQSLLGSGNIDIQSSSDVFYAWTYSDGEHTATTLAELQQAKEDNKIIVLNGYKIPSIQVIDVNHAYFTCYTDDDEDPEVSFISCNSNSVWSASGVSLQPKLISGTNIKTINNQDILGSGNITVSTTAAQIVRW